jgi:hypothetical protein
MVARAVEDVGRRLKDLQREEWEDGAVGAAALVLAVGASVVLPALALPLFAGGLFLTWRAVIAGWRRWDLVDRLLVERDAYTIPEVRLRAEREASMANRRSLSRVIRARLELAENPRVAANAGLLAALAEELADPELELDPVCAAACSRLLLDDVASPLVNPTLPADDVRSRLVQIRLGFRRRD